MMFKRSFVGGLSIRMSLLAVGAALVLVTAAPSQAALTLKTSRATLGGTDFIDWGTIGATFTTHTNPFSINTNGGDPVQVSKTSTGMFERRDQGNGWGGNFAQGDHLIWTRNERGPLVLEFVNPIFGGGAQIQRDQYGAFTATLEAFDSVGNSLGSFMLNGNSNSNGDNSAIFIGVLSNAANIKKLSFNVDGEQDFAINQTDLVGNPSSVPEPTSLALLGVGLAGLAARRRRKA